MIRRAPSMVTMRPRTVRSTDSRFVMGHSFRRPGRRGRSCARLRRRNRRRPGCRYGCASRSGPPPGRGCGSPRARAQCCRCSARVSPGRSIARRRVPQTTSLRALFGKVWDAAPGIVFAGRRRDRAMKRLVPGLVGVHVARGSAAPVGILDRGDLDRRRVCGGGRRHLRLEHPARLDYLARAGVPQHRCEVGRIRRRPFSDKCPAADMPPDLALRFHVVEGASGLACRSRPSRRRLHAPSALPPAARFLRSIRRSIVRPRISTEAPGGSVCGITVNQS